MYENLENNGTWSTEPELLDVADSWMDAAEVAEEQLKKL